MPLADLYKKVFDSAKSAPQLVLDEPVAEEKPKSLIYPGFDGEFERFAAHVKSRPVAEATRRKTERLKQFITGCLDNKYPLAKALNLDPDFRAHLEVDAVGGSLTDNYLYQAFDRFMRYIYDGGHAGSDAAYKRSRSWLEKGNQQKLQAVMDNKFTYDGREFRLTKFVLSFASPDMFDGFLTHHKGQGYVQSLKNNERELNTFMARLVEAQKMMKKPLIISANPLDIMLSSEKSGFTSCHSFESVHTNGNLAYCRDGHTAIIFINGEDKAKEYPFYKICRMFLYVDPATHKSFLIGRIYGTANEQTVAGVSSLIGQRLAGTLGVNNDWVFQAPVEWPTKKLSGFAGHRNSDNHEKHPIYFDLQASRFVYHKSLGDKNKTLEQIMPTWHFEKAMCPSCHKETMYNKYLACSECCQNGGYEHRCSTGCGHRSDDLADYTLRNGALYCKKCFQNHFFECACCGEESHRDSRGLSLEGNKYTCKKCALLYARCAFTGKTRKIDEMKTFWTRRGDKIFGEPGLASVDYSTVFETEAEAKAWIADEKERVRIRKKDATDRLEQSIEKLDAIAKAYSPRVHDDAAAEEAVVRWREIMAKYVKEETSEDEFPF